MEHFVNFMREAATLVGIEAARLWPKMVLVHWIKAMGALVGGVGLTVSGPIMAYFGFKYGGKNDWDRPQDMFLSAIGVIVCAVAGLWLLIGLPSNIATLMEPEASLMLQLLTPLKGN